MGRRCQSCSKFCGVEQADPEINSDDDHDETTVTTDITLTLNSECCGDEVATADVEVQLTNEHFDGEKHQIKEIESIEAEPCERWEGKGRYAKHFYGADVVATVKCKCGKKIEMKETIHEQASCFEEAY